MREFEFLYDEGVQRGLRRHHRNPRNVQGSVECLNVRISSSSPEPYAPVINPFSNLNNEWPFPQIIEAKGFSFLINRDPINMVDNVYTFVPGEWDLVFVAAIDEATFGIGGRFSIADFEDYVLLANGKAMIRYDTVGESFVPFISSSTIPLCNSVCAFKGQVIAGGIGSSWHGRGSNSLIWTKIGSADFTPGRDNEAGFRNAESDVYQVKRLGNFCIVYGSKSIGRLNSVNSPAPTFSWDELTEFGIANPEAVAGGMQQHVFVNEEGWLWSINAEGGMKKLGYQEFMQQLDLDTLAITYNRIRNDFFISDGEKSFLLTPHGLSEIHQCISGWIDHNRTGYGTFIDNGKIYFRWISDTFDMGYRSTKTAEVIEVGGSGQHVMRAGVDWRTRRQAPFIRSPMSPVNDQGVAYPKVVGNEFRVILESSNYEDIEIDYLKLRYKMSDLRSIRGVHAPPPRGQ